MFSKSYWQNSQLNTYLYFFVNMTVGWSPRIEMAEFKNSVHFSSVQSLSHVRLFVTPWTTACQASLSIINSHSPPKPMSIESMMPSKHLILGRPLLLLSSIFPSIRVFSNESGGQSIGVSASTSVLPMNTQDSSPFRMDWLDLLAVQGTLKSLLQHQVQHHNSLINRL